MQWKTETADCKAHHNTANMTRGGDNCTAMFGELTSVPTYY